MSFNRINTSFAAAFALFMGALFCGTLPVSVAAASPSDDPVYFQLSGRHFNASVDSMIQVAGGEDQLVAKLLELRRSQGLPYVSIRAEKLLLELANREDGAGPISSALEKDVTDAGYEGLARVVVTHIDTIQSDSLRSSLATKAVASYRSNDSMHPYLKNLSTSAHDNVRSAAKSIE